MEKVYLVIGTIWDKGSLETFSHTIVNDYAVHSTEEGARAELYRILEETNKEAKQHEITFEAHMKEDRLEKYLDELSEGTDFDFSISEIKNGEVELYMQGDNPCNEDWCTEITIKNPKTKKELIETLHEKMWELYDAFDVEEETYLMLEAKRNGFQGVPDVVDLVHNEEYKKNALKKFSDKLRDLL